MRFVPETKLCPCQRSAREAQKLTRFFAKSRADGSGLQPSSVLVSMALGRAEVRDKIGWTILPVPQTLRLHNKQGL